MATENLDRIGSEISDDSHLSEREAKKERKELFGDDKREEQKKEILHKAFLVFIIVISLLITVIVGVRLLHFVMPDTYCWLTAERIQNLDKFFFSGTIGGIVTTFIKKCLSTPSGKED